MRIIPIICAVLLAACSGSRQPPAKTETERVVQAHHDAFNRQNLDALLAVYAADAVLRMHPADTLFRGAGDIGKYYREQFQVMPRVRVQVRERRSDGATVTDELLYRGFPCGETYAEVVTYQVENGRIRTETTTPLSEDVAVTMVPGFDEPICPAPERARRDAR